MEKVIYRATLADREELVPVMKKIFYDTFNGTCTRQDMADVLEEFFNDSKTAEELQDPEDYYFILKIDNQIAGYVRMKEYHGCEHAFLDRKPAFEIKRFYITTNFFGSGASQALMEFCNQFFAEKKAQQIFLSVWEYNVRAQEFYKKNGFKTTGVPNPFPLGSTPQFDVWFLKDM